MEGIKEGDVEKVEQTVQTEEVETKKLPFDYPNPASGAIDFFKSCFRIVADWIKGPASKATTEDAAGDDSKNPADDETEGSNGVDMTNPAYGMLFAFSALVMLIASYVMNTLAAGTIFPSSESIEIMLPFGLMINLVPPIVLAISLTSAVVVAGILAVDEEKIRQILNLDEKGAGTGTVPRKRWARIQKVVVKFISSGWFALSIFVAVVAVLAAYRTYVYNAYEWKWNIPGIFLATALVEGALAVATSIGFRHFVGPILNRAFACVSNNWSGLRMVVRFILGLVGFVALSIPLIVMEVIYFLVRLPYYLIWVVYMACVWIAKKWRSWKDGAPARREKRRKDLDDERDATLDALVRGAEIRRKKAEIKAQERSERPARIPWWRTEK